MQRTEAGRGLGGLTKGQVFSLALSLMAGQEDLAYKRAKRSSRKEKSKKVLLYPRAPLKIKCFCNEFDLTIVESNQGRDAVQSPGEGVRLSCWRLTVTVTAAVGTNKHKHVSWSGCSAEADSSSTEHCQCTRPTPFHLPH